MEIQLNPTGSNSDRSPYTLSFHAAGRLMHSLLAWKEEIDTEVASGRESPEYRALVYDTIATEARHLIHWCRTQDLAQGGDYHACLIELLSSLICAIEDAP